MSCAAPTPPVPLQPSTHDRTAPENRSLRAVTVKMLHDACRECYEAGANEDDLRIDGQDLTHVSERCVSRCVSVKMSVEVWECVNVRGCVRALLTMCRCMLVGQWAGLATELRR